jgi:hypothetical protein
MTDYFQLEGLTYRLVPIRTPSPPDQQTGRVDTDIMFNNMMNKFTWGRMDEAELYIDHVMQRQCMNFRNMFTRLARNLLIEGDKERAVQALDKCLEVIPERNVPYDIFMVPIMGLYYDAGQPEKGKQLAERLADVFTRELKYYTNLRSSHRSQVNDDIQRGFYGLRTIVTLARGAGQEDFAAFVETELQALESRYFGR